MDDVVLAVVLVFGALATGCWAVRFHRSAFSAVHRPATDVVGADRRRPQVRRRQTAEAGAGRDLAGGRSAVGQLEATRPSEPVSVLGWDAFVLVSILFLDGSALLACRRIAPSARDASAHFEEADQTMVLRVGDDFRAAAALAVFEDWRRRRCPLRLRPIEVPGAIEILDARHNRIRAPLTRA